MKPTYLYELQPGTILQLDGPDEECNKNTRMLVTDKIVCHKHYRPNLCWRVLVNITNGKLVEWCMSAEHAIPAHWKIKRPN